jgi:hypothetical protein
LCTTWIGLGDDESAKYGNLALLGASSKDEAAAENDDLSSVIWTDAANSMPESPEDEAAGEVGAIPGALKGLVPLNRCALSGDKGRGGGLRPGA